MRRPSFHLKIFSCDAVVCAFLIAGIGAGGLLLGADESRQKVQISKTEHVNFQDGGTVRLKHSTGVLTVEGWDKPEIELTTIKSPTPGYLPDESAKLKPRLEKIHITAERKGDEFLITTDFPRTFPPAGLTGDQRFDLEYRIKAPKSSRLIVAHELGEVNVNNLTNDIDITLVQGEIMLHLPEDGVYATRAKSDFGAVYSDFNGREKHLPWIFGHQFMGESNPASHKLNLRVRYGDILILKTNVPAEPPPSSPGN
jgi:hypothetical protein